MKKKEKTTLSNSCYSSSFSVEVSILINFPEAEEDPGERSEIERALDQFELAKNRERKGHLTEQI